MARRRAKQLTPPVTAVVRPPDPPYVRRWMRFALLAGLLAAAAAGAWFWDYQSKWMHYPPKPDIRFQASARKLKVLPNVSPSEEYPGPDDETIWLTEDQFRAVNAAASLPGNVNRKLAKALAEPDPDRQAQLLFELVDGAPKTPDGDTTTLALFYPASAALSTPPHTPARIDARSRLDEMVGCRFYPIATLPPMNLPGCSRRPGLTPLYVLGALAVAPLLAILGSLLITFVRRVRLRRRLAPAQAAS